MQNSLNRTTVCMCILGLLLSVCGVAIVWTAASLGHLMGVTIGLGWMIFAGGISVFAWRTRYDD